ncbi:MAG TPA: SDR family oxidoreductase [Woeseiaceae bacterium]|nr:SDR family oxidoreductase [Woeseiaceae bacterium]
MAEPLRLYGMKALVTSAAGGIGEAVARTLVKHGAEVLAVDGPKTAVEQHFAAVRGIHGLATSFNDPDRIPALVEQAAAKLGALDILVNDFPLTPQTPITGEGGGLDELLRLRAELIMAMARSALPYLKKSPAGRIINMGFLRSAFAADAHAASQRAERDLAAVSRALAAETGGFGITANHVQPGGIMTPESRDVFRKDKALRDYCIASSAAKRLGEPVDVAKVVLFLASDDAVFVSGTGVAVDGGRIDD